MTFFQDELKNMSKSFDYDQMVQEALRYVVYQALTTAAEGGIPSPHYFYVTFQTNRPDVLMDESLKKQHPEEMTIVLQHQYWDLKVTSKSFSVTLSFNGEPQEITIPFVAITNFLDPSVKFSLAFEADTPKEDFLTKEADSMKKDTTATVVTLDAFRKK